MSSSPALFYLLVILYATSFVYSQSSTCDPSKPKTTTLRLKRDLLCGYDRQVRPVLHHSNQTTVSVLIAPRHIDFEESNSILKLSSWFGMSWTDNHLQWDPAEYDYIIALILDTKTIWVPDLTVYNGAGNDMFLDSTSGPCIVNKNGFIHAVTHTKHVFHCIPDWYNWPYDTHTCEMTMGSKGYVGSKLDIDFAYKKGMYMAYYMGHREWEIVNSSVSRNVTYVGSKNDTVFWVALNFKFILKRHASVYVASYVVPGLVVMLMSLCIPWLDASRSERITILCALVILEALYLQYIAYKLPSNGDRTPRVVCFYRDLLFMTVLLFIVSVITQQMSSLTWKPGFLLSVSNFVANNRSAQFIMLIDSDPKNAAELSEGEEAVTLVPRAEGAAHQWQMLSLLINRLTFLFVLIVYMYLSLYLLP